MVPEHFICIDELRARAIEHKLGYFGQQPFVLFDYSPEGEEVLWKDGLSCGFGTGGWLIYLEELGEIASRHQVQLAGHRGAGTHVLLVDRTHGEVYAAVREEAEVFLASMYGYPPGRFSCLSCPHRRTCPLKQALTPARKAGG